MRIKVLHKPPTPSIDGIRLDTFQPGCCYDVGPTLAALFLAEGWAEPITEPPALETPSDELGTDAPTHPTRSPQAPPNLHREAHPPLLDIAVTADAPPRPRGRKIVRDASET